MSKWTWVLIGITAVAVAVAVYALRPTGKTDAVINSIGEGITASQERADAIVASTTKKEVTARAETRKNTALLSDDELLDAINQMLREYRAGITY